MPKRKCKFRYEYSSEYSFISEGRTIFEAECGICHCSFSIANGGRFDIKQHMETAKHKRNMMYPLEHPTTIMTNFMIKTEMDGGGDAEIGDEGNEIIAAELTMAFHTVKHHQSFFSNECTNLLLHTVFSDSRTVSEFSCDRTKSIALIKNAIAPYTISEIVKDLYTSSFYGISTDVNKHEAQKIFPLVVQYFSLEKGLQIKLLRVKSLPDESSETIASFCRDSLTKLGVDTGKCIAFGGDNMNTNFGGRLPKDVNDLHSKLKQSMNNSMERVSCPARILHNAAQTAADVLSINVEVIVLKLFSYFNIYAIQTEELKDFCDFVNVQYSSVFSPSKTNWISLMNAVEKILNSFKALKSYCISQEKAPKILVDFFNNPLSETYLFLIHSFQYLFSNNIMQIEKRENSIIEVLHCLKKVDNCIEERINEKFIPFSVRACLNRGDITFEQKQKFQLEVDNYYSTCHDYLQEWISSLGELDCFSWMLLNTLPTWEQVESSRLALEEKGIRIDDNILFCQWSSFKRLVEQEMQREPGEWQSKLCHEKWYSVARQIEFKEQYSELLILCQYLFSIPAHNVNVEHVFSLMNVHWTKEQNNLDVTTIESLLQCEWNLNCLCEEFYYYVLQNRDLLRRAKSSDIYNLRL